MRNVQFNTIFSPVANIEKRLTTNQYSSGPRNSIWGKTHSNRKMNPRHFFHDILVSNTTRRFRVITMMVLV